MGRIECMDHTADVGLHITAVSWEELLQTAAAVLCAVMVDPAHVEARFVKRFQIIGDSRSDILVEWLRELLFEFDAHGFIGAESRISAVHQQGFTAEVRGDELDPERHRLRNETKAVTYRALDVEQTEHGWTATVILDV